jgi:hypothetical protein
MFKIFLHIWTMSVLCPSCCLPPGRFLVFISITSYGLSLNKMYWLLWRKSKLSTNNKLLIYKVLLKPTWTYGIQLWGTTSNSNTEILERFRSKVLRLIVDAPWYVSNSVTRIGQSLIHNVDWWQPKNKISSGLELETFQLLAVPQPTMLLHALTNSSTDKKNVMWYSGLLDPWRCKYTGDKHSALRVLLSTLHRRITWTCCPFWYVFPIKKIHKGMARY